MYLNTIIVGLPQYSVMFIKRVASMVVHNFRLEKFWSESLFISEYFLFSQLSRSTCNLKEVMHSDDNLVFWPTTQSFAFGFQMHWESFFRVNTWKKPAQPSQQHQTADRLSQQMLDEHLAAKRKICFSKLKEDWILGLYSLSGQKTI